MQDREFNFSITRETKELWEKLKKEGRQDEFKKLFWETTQGALVSQTIKNRKKAIADVIIGGQPGGEPTYIIVKVMPL